MKRVEFHCHTLYSKDSLLTPRNLFEACQRKGIEKVAITDHNTIRGALEAQRIAPEHVIVGEEIMTTQGELLAFFVQDEIPPGLSPEETIQRLRAQQAFISVSHPFDHLRGGAWKLADLQHIASLVDAIEIFNSRCMLPSFNQKAQTFASQNNLPGTVGSDAHAASELGRATLLLPEFHNAEELQIALQKAQPHLRLSPPWVHFISRYAVWRKKMRAQIP